jgi:hypothetical protein
MCVSWIRVNYFFANIKWLHVVMLRLFPASILRRLAIQRHGIATPWFTGWNIPHQLEGISLEDGRCGSEREIASSSIKGVLMAERTANSLRYYCTCHKKYFLLTKIWVPDWEFFGIGQNFHPSSYLSKLTWEHGGEMWSIPRSEDHARKLHPSGWRLEGDEP